MREKILLFFKGFLIGLGKVIPGVSGSVLAISFGLYHKAIWSISSIKNIKDEFPFIITLGLGIISSIILMSNIIMDLLEVYYLPTMVLFIGLICGGIIPFMQKKKKNIFVVLSFFLVIFINTFKVDNLFTNFNYIHVFLIGIIEAITMVIPGISGTAVLMMINCYDFVMTLFSSPFSHLITLIPFLTGIAFGIFTLIHFISYMFNRFQIEMNSIIIGFSLGTIFVLSKTLFENSYSNIHLIVSIPLFFMGYFLSRMLKSE